MQAISTKKLCALALAFTLTASAPAYARVCAGVSWPDTVTAFGTTLVLNGLGVREATALQFDVYVAGLYLETRSRDADAIIAAAEKKRLVLRFVRDQRRDELVAEFERGFERSAPAQMTLLRARIDRLLGYLSNVSNGESIQLTYSPGVGVHVEVNGLFKGVIEGDDFQRALFAIFIGAQPPNVGLRRGLLGGRCG